MSEQKIPEQVAQRDRKNLDAIKKAFDEGRINADARKYLETLYSDGMRWFRAVFLALGRVFGAPKAPAHLYDAKNFKIAEQPANIIDINPASAYMAYHRLDADPMRNQFFSLNGSHNITLSVSSIVNVMIGAQKSISRALEKITGKYYEDYVAEVMAAASNVLIADGREASARAIADKIKTEFSKKFITNASETVLGIIGKGHENIAVAMVRSLDKIAKPHERLRDVWRVKCLFDLIPQARVFIKRLNDMFPNKIMKIKDKFFDVNSPRNYRDAKIILDIGADGIQIPMEIICQVRTFFEYEKETHNTYETQRKSKNKESMHDLEDMQTKFMEDGIRQYNEMVCDCLDDLLDRAGWNILYFKENKGAGLFDGLPKLGELNYPYPQKVVDTIMGKLDLAVENEVFKIENAPRKLEPLEDLEIFRYMARFVLMTAMPYAASAEKIPGNTTAVKLFNFIMSEVGRYYKR